MKRLFGFLAVAGFVTFAAPSIPVQAASLIGPGAAEQTKTLTNDLAVEVRHGGRGGGFRGFHGGGGRHFGHAHFGGGHRFVHRHHFHGHRFVHHHRPFIVRRHVWRPYPYYYAEPRLYCRRVWTDFGPRRICRYRPWWA
jgi:hypothetical protein